MKSGPVKTKKSGGFTLIELTIVLVIMGLLMVMVVKGRDLLRSARTKQDYVNYVLRLYLDIFRYKTYVFERNGYEAMIGDGEENGGWEPEPDGYVDTGNLTVEDLLGIDSLSVWVGWNNSSNNVTTLNETHNFFSEVYLFNGTYEDLTDYFEIPEVDPDFRNVFGVSPDYFYFVPRGGRVQKVVRVYLGADSNGTKTGNFLIFYDLPADSARSFDRLIDDETDGASGKFLVLGFELSPGCSLPPESDTCNCTDPSSDRICVGRGAEGGCPFPLCSPEQIQELVCGYLLPN